MTLRPRDKTMIAALAAVALIAVIYLIVIAPVRHNAAGLSASMASTQARISQDESTVDTGRAAQATLIHDRSQWTSLQRAVPATSNIPALLRILQREASGVGASVQTISLSGSGATSTPATTAPTSATTSASAAGASGSGASQASQATAVPVTLTCAGSYGSLEALLHRLNSLVIVTGKRVRSTGPLMSISSMNLTGAGNKLSAQLTASIYQLDASTSGGASS